MKHWMLAMAVWTLATAGLQAKDYGRLRVTQDRAVIYHGADLSSKKEARADAGDIFVLRADNLIHGFYKIEYKGHVSFIHSGDVMLLDDAREPVPASRPTPAPTKVATRAVLTHAPTSEPTHQAEEEPRPMPTKVSTKAVPTQAPTPEPARQTEEEPRPVPTKVSTQAMPTQAPTPEPTRQTEEEPRPVPTKVSTQAMPTQAPTPEPTRQAVVVPTPEPTQVPMRTVPPTRVPEAEPTPFPTREAIHQPTPAGAGQVQPTPVPAPVVGRGRRLRDPAAVGRTVQRSAEVGALFAGVLSTRRRAAAAPAQPVYGPHRPKPQRPRDQLSSVALFVPLGAGPCVPVQPAFKPSAGSPDVRCIDTSSFVGFGLEGRTKARWLRIFGDWTVHQHSTLAANLSRTATAVGVPGVATILFPESDVHYTMGTHGLRLGLKTSLPFPIVEPWIGGGLGAYYWKAEYIDAARSISYGDDQGWAFGATALAGIDFSIPTSWGIFIITPFAEYGTPTVFPQVADIAGTGIRWKDTYGTPVMMPWRFGLGFGLGF